MFAALLVLDLVARAEANARPWWLGLSGAAAGLAFLFKQNVGTFAILAAVGYVLLRPRPHSGAFVTGLRLLFTTWLAVTVRSLLAPALDEWIGATLWLPLMLSVLLLLWWAEAGDSRARPFDGLKAIMEDGG